ncbi:MAG: UDP-N-acetylglucosamine 2-epimerase, partial [Pseudomonadota bacterium]
GFGLTEGEYGVVTLHRPSNVDQADTLGRVVDQLINVAGKLPLIFAVHPRTRKNLEKFDLLDRLANTDDITLCEPLSYIQFMNLVSGARLVLSDSGGIQEETTYLNVPCLTVRENTERPITITEGTNRLIDSGDIQSAVEGVLAGNVADGRRPELWDGKTAHRATASLARLLGVADT